MLGVKGHPMYEGSREKKITLLYIYWNTLIESLDIIVTPFNKILVGFWKDNLESNYDNKIK